MSTLTAHNFREKRVGVLMGGLSAERDISHQTGQAILHSLTKQGFRAVAIEVGTDLCETVRISPIDVAFIALHGRYGEDGCIQGLLESLKIPYTGSGVLASAIAMDKLFSKRFFEFAGLPTPPWCFPATEEAARRLKGPYVIKPRSEGSSVGVAIVHELGELSMKVSEPEQFLVESYISGRELSVAVMGKGSSAEALGTVEIRAASGFYDYEAKYIRDDTQYLVPAPISTEIQARVSDIALKAHRLLECSGVTRADFRWDESSNQEPLLLELNTLPGMTDHSLVPKIAAHAGISFDLLVERVLTEARLHA